MKFSGIAVGVVVAALLLALLGLTRLLAPANVTSDLTLREIEITSEPEPPPPPPEEEPPPDAPPPPPSLTEVSEVPDPAMVPIPKADVPMDVTMPVDPFFTDVAPAPLPQPVVRERPRPAARAESRPSVAPRPAPRPVLKSSYSVGELDGKPQLLRHGRASFPSSLARKGVSQGTVTLRVEINASGGVRVLGVISATHQELVASARKVAAGSKFTTPKKNGQSVKAVMAWPIVIRK